MRIIDPDTTIEVYESDPKYHGAIGKTLWQNDVEEACRVVCNALRRILNNPTILQLRQTSSDICAAFEDFDQQELDLFGLEGDDLW